MTGLRSNDLPTTRLADSALVNYQGSTRKISITDLGSLVGNGGSGPGSSLAAEVNDRIAATRDTGVLPLTGYGGTADAITADLTAASGVTALSGTTTVELIPAATNTGPVTLNVAGAGTWPIQKRTGAGLVAGDLKAGATYLLRRRSSAWRIVGVVDSDVDAKVAIEATARSNVIRDTGLLALIDTTGTASAITADLAPSSGVTAVSATSTVILIPASSNAGAVTLNVAGAGAWPIQRRDGAALVAGDLKAGQSCLLRRNGNAWRMLGPASSEGAEQVVAEATLRAAEDARRIVGAGSFGDGTLLAFTSQKDGSVIIGVDQIGTRIRGSLGGEEIVTVPDLYAEAEDLRAEAHLAHSRLEADVQARGRTVLGGRLEPDYIWALTTKFDGSVIMGLRADGRLVHDRRVPGHDAFAMDGTGYVIAPDDSHKRFSYGDPDNPVNLSDLAVDDARIEENSVRVISRRRALWRKTGANATPYLIAGADTPLITRLPVMSAPFVNAGISKLYAIINYGQSFASFSMPTLTLDPVAPGKALMFSLARNAPKLATWGLTVPTGWDWAVGPAEFDRDISAIGDLCSRAGETPSPGMAAHLLRSPQSVPADAALFMINLANGGVDHKNLVWPVNQNLTPADPSDPATVSQWTGYRFEQIIRALKVLRYQCSLHGLELEVRAITYMHGEADVALGWQYQDYLEHSQRGFTARIACITGQTYEVPVICDQADWRKAPSLPGATSWAQLKAGLDNPGKIACAGPHYWIPRLDSEGSSDGLHPTAAGRRAPGHNYGRAMNALWASGGYLPLHVSAAVRSGTTVELTFAGNNGPLVIDTTAVTPAPDGHHGITWHQVGGNSPNVIEAAITGANTMRVTLDTAPAGYSRSAIHVASNVGDRDVSDPLFAHYGPVNGPRSNIRDSAPTLGHGAEPLYNWACHQEINLA
ncbi:MAG: hypothetical protein Q4G26_07300 [Paracoccus sp. (in: a-proteobacteria)]|nr:hypothetical protein [Paracoccus sp. (in: a-proteobacteria)]